MPLVYRYLRLAKRFLNSAGNGSQDCRTHTLRTQKYCLQLREACNFPILSSPYLTERSAFLTFAIYRLGIQLQPDYLDSPTKLSLEGEIGVLLLPRQHLLPASIEHS